jgi:hypothetical protein
MRSILLRAWRWSECSLMPRVARSVVPMTAHCKLRAYGFFVGKDVLMTVPDEPLLTVDEAYRATFHFINQYHQREPIVPFMLMLSSMTAWSENGDFRETSDPATWNDWMASVRARASEKLPEIAPPRET